MEVRKGRVYAYKRVLGMTLASLQIWFILSIYGLMRVGPPSQGQSFQALLVAIRSGVIVTVLFFMATDLVRGNMRKMATVEATQSMEVVFALAGELIFLSIALPALLSWVGILVVVIGMILHSFETNRSINHVPKL